MATIQYAGEYQIEVCEIYAASGTVLDLKDQFASVNIYEDIFKNALTGDISIVDTNNLLTNLPIMGQEKLKLRLVTPNSDDESNRGYAIDFTDSPLYIYKVDSKVSINDNTNAYTLSFTTPEAVRSNRIRITQAFDGEPSIDIIKKVFRDEELLNSKKEFYYEETANKFKLVAPNQRPFAFINSIARRCNSKEYNDAPTFLFYETTRGYFFRTLDSMMDRKNPKMVFRELTPNEADMRKRRDLLLQNILQYDVVGTTDTMASRRSGMYSSKLLLLDLLNKGYEEYDYDYLEEFDNDIHVDEHNRYGSEQAPVVSEMVDDYNNKISEYPESVYYVQTIDKDGLFDGAYEGSFDYKGTDKWLQRRKSRFASLNSSVALRVRIHGNTTLQAGDLVGIVINDTKTGENDQTLTGRYLVRKLHHVFTRGSGKLTHTILMDCVRDTVQTKYPDQGVAVSDGGSSIEEIIPKGSSDPADIIF